METQLQKMLSGKLYDPNDPIIEKQRINAYRLTQLYNATSLTEKEYRVKLLKELIPNSGENLCLQGPIYFDYGLYTTFGNNCYANFSLTILDVCPVTIGDNVFFGPNCSILTPMHAFLSAERNMAQKSNGEWYDIEYGKPVAIGSNCWIAGNVTICGGAVIGEGCVIGAGSVITGKIPPNSLAFGIPCRVIRKITEKDSILLKKELF